MPRSIRHLALGLTAAFAVFPAATQAASVQTIDGPSADIVHADGVDVAADGTGGLVYVKKVGGVDHVFVARLANGTWSAGARIDAGEAQASLRPRIAASNGGKLVVTFLNGPGANYRVLSAISEGTGQPFTTVPINNNPAGKAVSIDLASDGTGCAIWTGFDDVIRAARLTGSIWTDIGGDYLQPTSRLSTIGQQAGGPGPQTEGDVAAAPGRCVLTWTETLGGGGFEVRVLPIDGTVPGTLQAASIPALNGVPTADFSDMNEVAIDDAGVAHVAFRQQFTYPPAQNIPHTLVRALTGNTLGPAQVTDGLPIPPTEGSEFPSISVSPGGGSGLVAMPRQLSFQTFAARMTGSTWSAGTRVDAGTPDAAGTPTATVANSGFGAVAYVEHPSKTVKVRSGTGTLGSPETLGTEPVFNSMLTVDTASDGAGNAYVVFAHGAASKRVAVARIDAPASPSPPGAPPVPGPLPPTVRTVFLKTPLFTIYAKPKLTKTGVAVKLRNREPFTVRATLVLRTAKKIRVRGSKRAKRITLGTAQTTIRSGQTKTLTLKLSKSRRALARRNSLRIDATLRSPGGNQRVVKKTTKVKPS